MIQLAEDVFAVRNDPQQLDVNQEVLERLRRIHPATVSEYDDGHGPVAWVLLIPTTSALMQRFIHHAISEKDLFEQTTSEGPYDALYLCSALVLQEYRRKGITRQLTRTAIEAICKDHPIRTLFVWSFTDEGNLSAEALASRAGLPLLKRSR